MEQGTLIMKAQEKKVISSLVQDKCQFHQYLNLAKKERGN